MNASQRAESNWPRAGVDVLLIHCGMSAPRTVSVNVVDNHAAACLP